MWAPSGHALANWRGPLSEVNPTPSDQLPTAVLDPKRPSGDTNHPMQITLLTVWPCLLGAFLIRFVLAFNHPEISLYNLGAIPTLPSVAWGSLRSGLT